MQSILPHSVLVRALSSLAVAVGLLAGGGSLSAQTQSGPDLNVDGDPYFATLTLESGFSDDPRQVHMRAGGARTGDGLGPDCAGSIATRPDVRLRYEAGSRVPLNVYATSDEADVTLVINKPDGTWICNHDARALGPAVLMEAPMSGTYEIWMGVYEGGYADATLHISERAPRLDP